MTTIEAAGPDTMLRTALNARAAELRRKLAGELVPEPDDGGGVEVRDTGDESVVLEHAGVRVALLACAARELRDLESALGRLAEGSYCQCIECGLDIEPARLLVLPTARRCSVCQGAHEHRAALGVRR